MSIRRRGKGQYQVRVPPFPAVTVPTKTAAEDLELDLKKRARMGAAYIEEPCTLGEELDRLLEQKTVLEKLEPRGVEYYAQSMKTWKPLRGRLIPQLHRGDVEPLVLARARKAPTAARNELQVLKAALRKARSRGQVVDEAILAIAAVKVKPREGRALTVEELYALSSWFPEHAKRLVLVAGMVGARQGFWFGLTDRMLDLEKETMDSPAGLQKNRRRHRVYLTPIEVTLLREQLLARAKGVRLVFPSPMGRTWTRHHFRDRVWMPALAAAAKEDDVYEGFTFHLLRHTAGSLMALAGMDPAVAAQRLGHRDGGALFLHTYRHLYEGEKRSNAAKLQELVKRELEPAPMDKEGTSGP